MKLFELNGRGAKVLDDTSGYQGGYIENGVAYLTRSGSRELLACDLQDGVMEADSNTLSGHQIDSGAVYGDGYLYYSPPESRTLYQIKADGTEEKAFMFGYNIYNLCYEDGKLWFTEGPAADVIQCAYILNIERFSILAMNTEALKYTETSLVYRTAGESVTLCFDLSAITDVVIPSTIDGLPVTGIENANFRKEGKTYYYEIPAEQLSYRTTASGVEITGYTPSENDVHDYVAVPAKINDLPVVKINDGVFENCAFTGVMIQSGVQEIGEKAFYASENLQRVVFPPTLVSIGRYAFRSCRALSDVQLPESLQVIENTAFARTALTQIVLPKSLSSVVYGFVDTPLTDFLVDSGNTHFKAVDGVLFSADGKTLISYPDGRQHTDYVVPQGVEKIEAFSFCYAANLQSVTLPDSVRTIGRGAFQGCKALASVQIPDSVEIIKAEAFEDCPALKLVEVSSHTEVADPAGVEVVVR